MNRTFQNGDKIKYVRRKDPDISNWEDPTFDEQAPLGTVFTVERYDPSDDTVATVPLNENDSFPYWYKTYHFELYNEFVEKVRQANGESI